MTYTISTDPPSITCHVCGRTSYHPEDVRQRYCGNCHVFHDEIAIFAEQIMNRDRIENILQRLVSKTRWAQTECVILSGLVVLSASMMAWILCGWMKAGSLITVLVGPLCLAVNALALAVNLNDATKAWRKVRHIKKAHASVIKMYAARGDTAREHHFDQATAAIEAAKR